MPTRNLATKGLKRCETFIIYAANFVDVHARGRFFLTYSGIPLVGCFFGDLTLAYRVRMERKMLEQRESSFQARLQLYKERVSEANAKLAKMVGPPDASDKTTQG